MCCTQQLKLGSGMELGALRCTPATHGGADDSWAATVLCITHDARAGLTASAVLWAVTASCWLMGRSSSSSSSSSGSSSSSSSGGGIGDGGDGGGSGVSDGDDGGNVGCVDGREPLRRRTGQ